MIDVSRIESAAEAQHAQEPFSGVIVVREGGSAVFARGYGYANRADCLPNTPQTRFGTASGSKTFTAVAICQLVEQGKIAFDTRLRDCLDADFPALDPGVTIHHLLSHTSGIGDYFDEEVLDASGDYGALWGNRPTYTLRQPRDFLPLFRDRPAKFAPGERFGYNNAAFIVLAMVVEQQSGMPFPAYVEQNVFARAGMADSGYFALDQLPERVAWGYLEDGSNPPRTNVFSIPVIGGGDGGAFVTAPDMGRFWDALLAGRLVHPGLAAAMMRPHAAAPTDRQPDRCYGYGLWMQAPGGAATEVYGLGEDPGVAFMSRRSLAREVDFTVIGNTVDATWPMTRAVREALGES